MTREEAIKGLTSLVEVRRKYVGMQTMKDEIECLEMAIKALEQEPKWIPVSERLPEKYTYTLWCASSGYVRSDYFNGEVWEDAKKYCYEVIAWMPLPEPYKAESENKE